MSRLRTASARRRSKALLAELDAVPEPDLPDTRPAPTPIIDTPGPQSGTTGQLRHTASSQYPRTLHPHIGGADGDWWCSACRRYKPRAAFYERRDRQDPYWCCRQCHRQDIKGRKQDAADRLRSTT